MKISDLSEEQKKRIIEIMDRSIDRIENTKKIFLRNIAGDCTLYTHHECTKMLKVELSHLLRYKTYSSYKQKQEDDDLINNLTTI